MTTLGNIAAALTLLLSVGLSIGEVSAQTPCTNRGELNQRYCDQDGDLLADRPKDPRSWRNPETLVFSYTPVENSAVYEKVFADFMAYLGKVTGKHIRWLPVESYTAQVEAMRSGRLHIAGVASGSTPFAVNLAGFVPLVAMQRADGSVGYTLQLITRRDSSIKVLDDLKGKRVAHVAPSSNSGDTAPRALFKALGIEPGKDYQVLYSGEHDRSIMGVINKEYDAAPVASTVLERMQARGMFEPSTLRIVYQSKPFPRTAFGIAHDLSPELQEKIKQAFVTFDFKKSKLRTEFRDIERFAPISYIDLWRDVRTIQRAAGVTYTQENLSKLGTKSTN